MEVVVVAAFREQADSGLPLRRLSPHHAGAPREEEPHRAHEGTLAFLRDGVAAGLRWVRIVVGSSSAAHEGVIKVLRHFLGHVRFGMRVWPRRLPFSPSCQMSTDGWQTIDILPPPEQAELMREIEGAGRRRPRGKRAELHSELMRQIEGGGRARRRPRGKEPSSTPS